jgi:hypothetical protein
VRGRPGLSSGRSDQGSGSDAQDADLGAHRHTQALHHPLPEYFPTASEAFHDLDAADTLELLAPDPTSAACVLISQNKAPLKRARRWTAVLATGP